MSSCTASIPAFPTELAADEDALAKKRIYPDLRRAESRYVAVMLRNTLESSASGARCAWRPTASSSSISPSRAKSLNPPASTWCSRSPRAMWRGGCGSHGKRYEGDADIGSYKTDAALKARDPFQNVYSTIANDLVLARGRLAAAELRELRQVSELQFAQDIAPDALGGYLRSDAAKKPALTRVVRLPAQDDPVRSACSASASAMQR